MGVGSSTGRRFSATTAGSQRVSTTRFAAIGRGTRLGAWCAVGWALTPWSSTSSLTHLAQRYERRSATAYGYAAPELGFVRELEVAPSGFVRRYPELWIVEE